MARKVAPRLALSAATLAAIFRSEGVVLYSKMIISNEVYSCVVGLIRKLQLMFAPFEQRLFLFDSAEDRQCWLVQSLSFGRFFQQLLQFKAALPLAKSAFNWRLLSCAKGRIPRPKAVSYRRAIKLCRPSSRMSVDLPSTLVWYYFISKTKSNFNFNCN